MSQKKYRFFFHYNRQLKMMTVHWKGKCIWAKHVSCFATCHTKYNNKRQPKLVMEGWTTEVFVTNNTIVIR